jgi:spermidine synthase
VVPPRRLSAAPVQVRTRHALAEVLPEPSRPWRRLLRIDGEDAAHVDIEHPERIEFAYVRRLADVADLVAPKGRPIEAVHLGGGGFTLPRYIAATRPRSRSEVAEIDPGVLDLARQHLGLRTSRELRVRVADGRRVVERRRPASADLVVLDAFEGAAVPEHLVTVEFAREARRVLRPRGLFAANVIDVPPLDATRRLTATLTAVFRHVVVVGPRKVLRGRVGGNAVLVAGARVPVGALRVRAGRGAPPEIVLGGEALRAFTGGVRASRDGPKSA